MSGWVDIAHFRHVFVPYLMYISTQIHFWNQFRKTGRYDSFLNVLLWIPNLEQRYDDLLIVEHSSGNCGTEETTKSFCVQPLTNFLWTIKCLGAGNGLRQMSALAEINSSQIPGVRLGGDDCSWNWLIHNAQNVIFKAIKVKLYERPFQ